MKLDYYFIQEYQWKEGWKTKEGISKPVIRASSEVLSLGYVDYSILEGVFLHSKSLQEFNSAKSIIEKLRTDIEKGDQIGGLFNEIVDLEIRGDFCRPIDNLGSVDGLEAPLSWNVSTPDKLQFIPTQEVLRLFDDWLKFLKEVHEKPPRNNEI